MLLYADDSTLQTSGQNHAKQRHGVDDNDSSPTEVAQLSNSHTNSYLRCSVRIEKYHKSFNYQLSIFFEVCSADVCLYGYEELIFNPFSLTLTQRGIKQVCFLRMN